MPSLLNVVVPDDSPFMLAMAMASMFPVWLLIHLTLSLTTAPYRQSTVALLIGLFCNEVINYGLKHSIRQPRPDFIGDTLTESLIVGVYTPGRGGVGGSTMLKHDGYGMPSSHSQFVGFLFAFAMFYVDPPLL